MVVESYKDKDGNERQAVKIAASDIAYLSPRQGGQDDEEDREVF